MEQSQNSSNGLMITHWSSSPTAWMFSGLKTSSWFLYPSTSMLYIQKRCARQSWKLSSHLAPEHQLQNFCKHHSKSPRKHPGASTRGHSIWFPPQTFHCRTTFLRSQTRGFRWTRQRPSFFNLFRLGKAFDKIDHEKMFLSLSRLQIPPNILDNIKSLYSNPTFQVLQSDHSSDWQKQRTGIRQGCPLSPYLFILTMHVMFHDVKNQYHDPLHSKTFQGINFQELLYADDTLIIAKNSATANAFLHLIEK